MKQTLWLVPALLAAAALTLTAQAPAGQGKGKGRPRNPAQSPASAARPQTLTPQEYPAEQIAAGAAQFSAQCGFCHGRDATGGESGPDLTRSELVAEDVRGDKIAAVLASGRPNEGMPAFKLTDVDLGALVAFIHDQKTKFDEQGGGRRQVAPEDLDTGDIAAGRRYFNGAGGCSGCHSVEGDLAGVASRYQGLQLIQRMLYPGGRPAPARPRVTFKLESGETLVAPVAGESEFDITIVDPTGERVTYNKADVDYVVDRPLDAHFEQLGKYTDKDMHDVYAFLSTLR